MHNIVATWCEELTRRKRPWCWERVRAGGEGDARGWDGWMASLTQWTWAWANSGRQWSVGNPGMLQSMGSERAGHDSDWTTLWIYLIGCWILLYSYKYPWVFFSETQLYYFSDLLGKNWAVFIYSPLWGKTCMYILPNSPWSLRFFQSVFQE